MAISPKSMNGVYSLHVESRVKFKSSSVSFIFFFLLFVFVSISLIVILAFIMICPLNVNMKEIFIIFTVDTGFR